MKYLAICFAMLFTAFSLYADSPENYSQIRIFVPDKATLDKIWKSGIDFEGSTGKIGGWMEFITGSHEREQLKVNGISYSIVKEESVTPIPQGFVPGPATTFGFGYGSWSGFYTYDEVGRQLDSMYLLYPNLISQKTIIGITSAGRNIWAVKISDNPNVKESNEQEVLYTALHHAREPEGMMAVLYYMWWLLGNYGTNTDATYLVNNRQMWFIPVVNPDGYAYNQQLYYPGVPLYGWRKNRRDNLDGTYGVDLNRNYGPTEMWDSPYGGSDTYTGGETYRGLSPFSEPEVSAIRIFLMFKNVKTCLNYHTYGNYLVYPWGYLPTETPDSLNFREFAYDMVAKNRYLSGTDMQTVNYVTRGNSDDYMYGGGGKPQTYAMTPEVGTSGFWPPFSQILPLAEQNLSANIYYSYVAGQYSVVKYNEVRDANSDGYLDPGESFSLAVTLRNKGLSSASMLQTTISTNSPSLEFTSSTNVLSTLSARSDSTILFLGKVKTGAEIGIPVELYFTLTDTSGYIHQDTSRIFIGRPVVLLNDNANNGISKWNTGTGWGTTSDAHSSPTAFTDSPLGEYDPNSDNSLTLKSALDLSGFNYCILKFWTKWAIEPTYDLATIEASTNGGSSWINLRTKLSHIASGYGKQSPETWGFDGYNPGLNWTEQEIDLTSFVNKQLLIRFRLSSDGATQLDGWYVDDIQINGYNSSILLQTSTIQFTDNGSQADILTFGECPQATNGLEPFLGESELPSKPAQGTFDVRWNIASTNGTKIDYRDTLGSGNPLNTFIAEFQPGAGGYPFTIKWNPQGYLAGSWKLRDAKTYGTIFNVNMWADTMLIIPDTSIHSIEIVHTLQDTLTTYVRAGWNIVSMPMAVTDRSKSHIYSNAISDAFSYTGSYQIRDTLEYHIGYWLKFAQADTTKIVGIPIVRDTIAIPNGWWMISGLSCPLLRDYVYCNSPPCNAFQYVGYYRTDATINPGEGFWMKGPKTLIISCFKISGSAQPKPAITGELNSLNTLNISDHEGRKTILYFGLDNQLSISPSAFELPPIPPAGSFDARFASQRFVETFSSKDNLRNQVSILLQSSSYPLTVEWNIPNSPTAVFEISSGTTDGSFGVQSLKETGKLLITNPSISSLVLKKKLFTFKPKEYSLNQNFPNPFNPSTTIEFDIPTPSNVSLSLFNILGQEIQSIMADQYYPSGRFDLSFDGSNLTSGLYFYRLTAKQINSNNTVSLTRKMVLLK